MSVTSVADPAPEAWVAHAVLHRTSTGWRTVVAETPDKVTRGSLLLALPSDRLELAAAEFERMLRAVWGVEGPVSWRATEPDRWTAELRWAHLNSADPHSADPHSADPHGR